MEDCTQWDESERAKHILRILKEVEVEPAPEEELEAIDEVDVPCLACGVASKPCHVDRPAAAPGVDCRNVQTARRAVAALLAFEDGLLTDALVTERWAMDDDVAAMKLYMAEQRNTDGSYIPGILQVLDELYGSYRHLIEDHDYRANLRRRGKGSENVAILPRYADGKVEFLEDKLNAEVTAKEESVAAIKKQLDEQEGEDDDDDDDDFESGQDDEDWEDDRSEGEDKLDGELVQLKFDIELLERRRPITKRFTNLQHLLLRYRDVCVVCKAAGRQSNHSIRTCVDEKSRKAQTELLWAEKVINFNRNLCCLRCGVPNQICSRWEEEQRGMQMFQLVRLAGRCCFEGVALETIYGIKYGYDAIWNAWLDRLEERGVHLRRTLKSEQAGENVLIYLSEKNRDELVEERYTFPSSNNLNWEFEWITLAAEKRGDPTVR